MLTADAKKNKNKKIKKNARKKYRSQVGQCEALVNAGRESADNPAECVAEQLPCREFLSSCDFLRLFTCRNTMD
jgi:hypothetical protein